MKITKLLVLAVSVFVVQSASPAVEEDPIKNKLYAALVGGHTQAFGVDRLFAQQLKYRPWEEAVIGLTDYVTQRSKNVIGVKDSTLLTILKTIEVSSMQMINAIKTGFGARNDKIYLKQTLYPVFVSISIAMVRAQSKLADSKFSLKQKNNAKEMLGVAAEIIRATLDKAMKDIDRLVE